MQILKRINLDTKTFAQVLHAFNPEGAQLLKEAVGSRFKVEWKPMGLLSLVLGAHVGPSMVGVVFAPTAVFADLP